MAYITATVKSKDQPFADGRVRCVITFAGDAGEPARDVERVIDANDTIVGLRQWAFATAAQLGARGTVANLINVGATLTLTAPPNPPAPTAAEVWRGLASRLVRAKAIGLTAPVAVSDIAALEASVNSTYQAGFVDGL